MGERSSTPNSTSRALTLKLLIYGVNLVLFFFIYGMGAIYVIFSTHSFVTS